uniref:Uncharacterized protein n=1 Tax=Acrobeloides nanus TaxID=290746 RepID=A0A914EGN7_9BILA
MIARKLWFFVSISLAFAYAENYIAERQSFCDGSTLECKSVNEISELIDFYRSEAAAAKSQLAQSNCSICSLVGQPCLNGGTCVPLDTYRFACACPDNYTGNYCQIPVVCGRCGVNANCTVKNHRATCYCLPGYTGDPRVGCYMKKVTACATGDPHYRSFDKNYFDYQGTCPYIFTKNCKPINGYQNFSVKARNKQVSPTAHVSYISEVEVNLRGITIHIDEQMRLYVNGIRAYYNYYYPSYQNPQVSVLYKCNGEVKITGVDNIEVVFKPWSLCVSIPDVADFQGPDVLCGLAGNRDKNCQNDLTMSNGTIVPSDSDCHESDRPDIEWFGDTWITEDFLDTQPAGTYCEPGHIVSNRTINCDLQQARTACSILEQVMTGNGVFGICIGLGNETVVELYDDCVYDVCYGANRCSILAAFAQLCQSDLPFTDLGNWRTSAQCPSYYCPPNSGYSSCASSCQPTCGNPNSDNVCTDSCTEGCNCDPGYVVDTSADTFRCININDCGCSDSNNNYYPPNSTWLTNNCTQQLTCQNGSLTTTYHSCGPNAQCNVNLGVMACQCLPGYTGNGYNCVDINECLDPITRLFKVDYSSIVPVVPRNIRAIQVELLFIRLDYLKSGYSS